jgi:SAM-dependent methyltransferase
MSKSDSSFLSNQDGYDQWSAFYDVYPNPTVAIDDLTFPATWKDLSGLRILEVGCGTGRHTRRLLAQGNRVCGLDLSKGMLDAARLKLGDANVDLIQADILTYDGFNPEAFDAVVSALVVEHIEDLERLFRVISRLLKFGGRFFLSEIHPDRTAQGVAAHFVDQESGEEVHLRSFAHTEQGIRLAARNAGLSITASESILGDQRLGKINPKWERYLGRPMIQIWVFEKAVV